MIRSEQPPAGIRDAYLDWGIRTNFRFVPGQISGSTIRSVGLLIRWKSLEDAHNGGEIAKSFAVWVPRIYRGSKTTKIRLVWVVSMAADQVVPFLDAIEPLVARVELASPVSGLNLQPRVASVDLKPDHEILAAVLDDGCAFANARFMTTQAGKDTPRVLWLWNQNPEAPGFPLDAISGPSPDCDFNYGGQWCQDDLQQLIDNLKSQELAYAAAGLSGLRRSAAHGPHVMDLLAGREDWPMIFVQFPKAAIDDPSGVWLKNYVIDGLQYVIGCAGPKTKTIVANISWGPQTGPHNGLSELEAEIDKLVAEQLSAHGRTLIVSVPAGNSFSLRAHAEVSYKGGGSFEWILPPDGHSPAFLEIWWPNGVDATKTRLQIKPPGLQTIDIPPKIGTYSEGNRWSVDLSDIGGDAAATLTVQPTENSDSQFCGRHGEWIISFKPGAPAPGDDYVHVYLARATHNMGARRLAKASYLTDAELEGSRFVSPGKRFDEASHSLVRRGGTLNGMATGTESVVAAGYRLRDLKVAPYSSSGPSRPRPAGARIGPNYACVTDVSEAVPGLRASGVRSGTTIRLVGTSMAAPQLARQLANGPNAAMPGLNPPNTPQRVGAGCLVPDKDVIHKE